MVKMATVEWTEGMVSELITLYEERPCLYNTKAKDYFNRDLRRKSLEEIGKTGESWCNFWHLASFLASHSLLLS